MITSFQDPAYLVLSDGTCLEGKSFGYKGNIFGEVVFNTGMTGYQEVLTDPSYYGQLVTFTYPELGNIGVNNFDQESSSPTVKGVLAREINFKPSNWRSTNSLHSWLEDNKVIGIYGIDTRALVRHLREYGSMNGVISSDKNLSPDQLLDQLSAFPSMEGMNLAREVSTDKPYKWTQSSSVEFDRRTTREIQSTYRVVVIDFGVKKSILERLVSYGCELEVLPYQTDISTVMSYRPDGIFFSNGPGDPSAVEEGIDLAKALLKRNIPMFGICLGHQILGLALGGKTFKLNYGHRGLNHPCGTKGRLEITSQNHGFALDSSSLSQDLIEITHFNLNDGTVAGIAMKDKPVFGIQYHPEASPGPHDADHHFSRFVELMADSR